MTYEELYQAAQAQGFAGSYEEFRVAYDNYQRLNPATEAQIRGLVADNTLVHVMNQSLKLMYKNL
ncbi:MAG: hypothetical protein E7202_10375 [Selenomonas ruminantium]|jgi:hypothetical protein|nr:hypothetical protein [Selenomonas ruminantium]